MSELLTYCTGHHLRSVLVSLEGNASQKERSLQEARHSETWSSGFYCVGYPVGSLQQEPLFNPNVAWCIQCHPVCRLWGSICLCAWLNPLCRNATFGNLRNAGRWISRKCGKTTFGLVFLGLCVSRCRPTSETSRAGSGCKDEAEACHHSCVISNIVVFILQS